jgi:hemolysin activation/secretion protein
MADNLADASVRAGLMPVRDLTMEDSKRPFRLPTVVGTLALFAGVAHSQTAPDPAREAAQIQREQQEAQRRELEQQRRKLPAPGGAAIDSPDIHNKAADAGGACRDIAEIDLGSSPNLPATERARITKAYSGRCLGVRDIEQLMADVTNAYVERGYVTTRVYLPAQDLSSGKLTLAVVEGVVEKISLAGKGSERISLGSALPGVEGRPLNLRDLEQGLDQINRLQSNRATFDIVPGETPGSSHVLVRNQAARAFHFNATADSMGQDSTGEHQAGLSAAFDSPLGLNDYVSVMYRQSLPLGASDREAKLGSVTYLIPYGYSTTSLAYSRSDYASFLVAASGARVVTEGESEITSARLENVLLRSRSNRMTLATSVAKKSAQNYLAGQLLGVNSRDLTVLDLSLNYTTGLLRGVFSVEAGYSRGIDMFGALSDADDLASDVPRAQFRRYNYSASYSVPFRAAGMDVAFSSALNGQHARTALFGTEQIYAGGLYSVRGFENASLAGDHGLVWRNEFSMRQPLNAGGAVRATLRPFIAVDYGRTWMLENNTGVPEGALSGATVGLGFSTRALSLEVFNSRPLHVPSFMERESSQTYFRFSLSL